MILLCCHQVIAAYSRARDELLEMIEARLSATSEEGTTTTSTTSTTTMETTESENAVSDDPDDFFSNDNSFFYYQTEVEPKLAKKDNEDVVVSNDIAEKGWGYGWWNN